LKFLRKLPKIILKTDRQRNEQRKIMELPMSQVEQGPAARRWTRHRIDVRLKVSYRHEQNMTSAHGRANSLSHGGIGAYIPCTIPVGDTVSLELTFPYSSTEAKLDAIVRSCEGFRYGLEFIRVSDAVQEMIVKNCGGDELLQ
jgi:c-di-GMP-binding flagellar brake protein YcgR